MFPEPCDGWIHIPLGTLNAEETHPIIRKLGFRVSGLCATHEGEWLHARMPKGWTHRIFGSWFTCIDRKGRGRVQIGAPNPKRDHPGLLVVNRFFGFTTTAVIILIPADDDGPARSACYVQSQANDGNGAKVYIAFELLPLPDGITDANAPDEISLASGIAASRVHNRHYKAFLRFRPHAQDPLAYWN